MQKRSADGPRGGGRARKHGRNADERTGLLEWAPAQGRHLAPRVHRTRRRARRLERRDFDHAGEGRRGQGGRNAQERRDAEARPRRRQHDRQPRLSDHQRLRDDQRQPRALELPRRMGRGRQAASGAGGELGADQRREGLDLQAAQGRDLLERQGIHRRRRDLFAQPASGRHEIGRLVVGEGRHRHQEDRRPPDPDLACAPRTPTFPTA